MRHPYSAAVTSFTHQRTVTVDLTHWLAYYLMAVSLGAAILLRGGVYPQQWEWSALGISVGAAVWVFSSLQHKLDRTDAWSSALLGALLVWMLLQLAPLPPGFVALDLSASLGDEPKRHERRPVRRQTLGQHFP